MRIKLIKVTDLFGTFNYEIPLNLEEHATIIIGPNGYGKTTILKMISGIFNGQFSIFFKIPFSFLGLEMDNGGYLRIIKSLSKKTKRDAPSFDLNLYFSSNGKADSHINLLDLSRSRSSNSHDPFLEFLERDVLDRDFRNQMANGAKYIDDDEIFLIIEKYWEFLGDTQIDLDKRELELMKTVMHEIGPTLAELRKFTKKLNIHLIQAQRLTSYYKNKLEKKTKDESPVVKIYSDELVKLIAEKLAKSTEMAQELDSTFPNRIVSHISVANSLKIYAQLRDDLQKLREKRIHLKETGILLELGDELEIPEYIEDEQRLNFLNGVLIEYVSDTQQKLSVFDELSDKIEILTRVINERFTPHKKIRINKDRGFAFITPAWDELLPTDLSSGEQHELVLLYELLFKVPSGSLVLIDEPELSLHIAWQQKFLEDVLEISKIAKFEILVTTHAPDIIHNRWDLTVDLGDVKASEG